MTGAQTRCLGSWRGVWAIEEVIAQCGKGVPKRVVLRAPELSTGVPHKLLQKINMVAAVSWRISHWSPTVQQPQSCEKG